MHFAAHTGQVEIVEMLIDPIVKADLLLQANVSTGLLFY